MNANKLYPGILIRFRSIGNISQSGNGDVVLLTDVLGQIASINKVLCYREIVSDKKCIAAEKKLNYEKKCNINNGTFAI